MSPTRRKILYAVSFEVLGTLVAALGLMAMSEASPSQSFALSAIGAAVAMSWSYAFNTAFEAWEARQPLRNRSFRRRAVHALLFEGGLVLVLIPIMAWWLDVGLVEAAAYEAGLILVFILYAYAFTWAFDRLLGLPASAR
ncbi:MAG: PACE efflux transporter [Tabrizicola sp.]|nr:PACE efflux transporter [Tabrizicola sp.]